MKTHLLPENQGLPASSSSSHCYMVNLGLAMVGREKPAKLTLLWRTGEKQSSIYHFSDSLAFCHFAFFILFWVNFMVYMERKHNSQNPSWSCMSWSARIFQSIGIQTWAQGKSLIGLCYYFFGWHGDQRNWDFKSVSGMDCEKGRKRDPILLSSPAKVQAHPEDILHVLPSLIWPKLWKTSRESSRITNQPKDVRNEREKGPPCVKALNFGVARFWETRTEMSGVLDISTCIWIVWVSSRVSECDSVSWAQG